MSKFYVHLHANSVSNGDEKKMKDVTYDDAIFDHLNHKHQTLDTAVFRQPKSIQTFSVI